MTSSFADTSFYVAILSPQDFLHQKAKDAAAAHDGSVVTTEFVLLELGNFLCRGDGRRRFEELLHQLETAAGIVVVPASADLFQRGFELFRSRPDKEWSLTDCTSFVVMNDLGLNDALTADRHFQQAGFTALLL